MKATINGHPLEHDSRGYVVDVNNYYGEENPIGTLQAIVDTLGTDSSAWPDWQKATWDHRAAQLGFGSAGGVVTRPSNPVWEGVNFIGTPPNPMHQQDLDFITQLYRTRYNRPPDPGGLNFWAGELENGSQTRAGVAQVFATSPDLSPNTGQTLKAYLDALGIAPLAGYRFSEDGHSIVPLSTSGTDPNPLPTQSTIPFIGPFIDGLGGFAVGLPLVGPYIASWSQSFGISPGWIAIGGIAIGLYCAGAFDGGGGRRR